MVIASTYTLLQEMGPRTFAFRTFGYLLLALISRFHFYDYLVPAKRNSNMFNFNVLTGFACFVQFSHFFELSKMNAK